MKKGQLLYEGKAKKLYATDEEQVIWAEYLDQATALNGARKDEIKGKGELNNQITSEIFLYLSDKGIENHFIEKLSKTEQLIKKVEVIPLEVVVRNLAAGSFSKRLGITEGTVLPEPILEFYYKEDALDDPFINEAHIAFLKIAAPEEIRLIKEAAEKVNQELIRLFQQIGLELVDFKIEFGRQADGTILLADEISPDTCRLWEKESGASMDKDNYRKQLGDLVPVYREVLQRLTKISV
ncbi:phosphoribosylaminoimidazolesuccinocarboxamide synthase [Enterococcus sp. DIV0210g]|uniref:phosphoribosylaminoimidazolesuccinocarboxamide synthase n=1 Tax=Enterococcus sp. DIV0210g TaxID=2774656 RepID=UPI003D2FCC12